MTNNRVRSPLSQSMLTRDGVRLDADVYYPDAPGEFPVLLMRQPYGRAIASTVTYAHPIWYASHGYIVVIQDVRGRGSSEGDFHLFAHEIDDGFDSVAWAAQLPQSTGRVGMYGFSYQGMTQLYAAAAHPPELKAICPAMIAYDLYEDWAYEGGAFCLQSNLGWAIQLAAETVRRQGNVDAYETLYAAARNLPLSNAVDGRSPLLSQLAPDSHYHEWLAHATPDDYWRSLSPSTHLADVDLPMLHIGGWFDTYMRGTLKLYQAMVQQCHSPQHLWVGPWAHLPWGSVVGQVDYGAAANSPIDRVQLRWFDRFLKDSHADDIHSENAAHGLDEPIQLFELGTNHWRSLPTYPQAPTRTYYLHSNGLANMDLNAGLLSDRLPPDDEPCPDVLVHDPWRPVPALGGHATMPSGSFDRTTLDCRSDILTYTSQRLREPLAIATQVQVMIWCDVDLPSFDLCVVLSDIHNTGQVYNLAQGYRRIQSATPNTRQAVAIALQPICAVIFPGHQLRLSISAACAPAYAVNPGTGSHPNNSQLIDAKVTTIKVFSTESCPSVIQL